MSKYIECSQCKSKNTEIEVDRDVDEYYYVCVWCKDCLTYSPFPLDEDWREYYVSNT